jgi:predicted CopG family antitoxin
MVKTITVKDGTWEKLTIKKIKEKFKNLDELINDLLEKSK